MASSDQSHHLNIGGSIEGDLTIAGRDINITHVYQNAGLPRPDKPPMTAPPLPPSFVMRPEVMAALRQAVLGHDSDKQPALTAVQGMGGVGKSVMAIALCHDPDMQAAFPGGVIWVTLGSHTISMLEAFRSVGAALGDNLSEYYLSIESARSRLRALLPELGVLLVLDDVWEREHIEPFRFISESSHVLFTTRQAALAAEVGATAIHLDSMQPAEAIALLTRASGKEDPGFLRLAEQLGYLPLALEIAGVRIGREGTADEWLARFDRVSHIRTGRKAHDRTTNLEACFALSVEWVFREHEDEKSLYFALGIFQEDLWIPRETITRLWATLKPGLDELDCSDILDELVDLALVERRAADGLITLHDLLHDYTLEQLGGQVAATHQALLDSANPHGAPWPEIEDDGYIHRYLCYHLLGAGQVDELYALLTGSPDWLLVQTERDMGLAEHVADIAMMMQSLPDPLDGYEDILRFLELWAVRHVVHGLSVGFEDRDLITLVNLGLVDRAIGYARLRSGPDKHGEVRGLLAVRDSLPADDPLRQALLTEALHAASAIVSPWRHADALLQIAERAQDADDFNHVHLLAEAEAQIRLVHSHAAPGTQARPGEKRPDHQIRLLAKLAAVWALRDPDAAAEKYRSLAASARAILDDARQTLVTLGSPNTPEHEKTHKRVWRLCGGVFDGLRAALVTAAARQSAVMPVLVETLQAQIAAFSRELAPEDAQLKAMQRRAAMTLAEAGHLDLAASVSELIEDPFDRVKVMEAVGDTLIRQGRLGEADTLIDSLDEYPYHQGLLLIRYAEAIAASDTERAAATLARARQMAERIEYPGSRADIFLKLMSLARRLGAEMPDLPELVKAAASEIDPARNIGRRLKILRRLSDELARASQFADAETLARSHMVDDRGALIHTSNALRGIAVNLSGQAAHPDRRHALDLVQDARKLQPGFSGAAAAAAHLEAHVIYSLAARLPETAPLAADLIERFMALRQVYSTDVLLLHDNVAIRRLAQAGWIEAARSILADSADEIHDITVLALAEALISRHEAETARALAAARADPVLSLITEIMCSVLGDGSEPPVAGLDAQVKTLLERDATLPRQLVYWLVRANRRDLAQRVLGGAAQAYTAHERQVMLVRALADSGQVEAARAAAGQIISETPGQTQQHLELLLTAAHWEHAHAAIYALPVPNQREALVNLLSALCEAGELEKAMGIYAELGQTEYAARLILPLLMRRNAWREAYRMLPETGSYDFAWVVAKWLALEAGYPNEAHIAIWDSIVYIGGWAKSAAYQTELYSLLDILDEYLPEGPDDGSGGPPLSQPDEDDEADIPF